MPFLVMWTNKKYVKVQQEIWYTFMNKIAHGTHIDRFLEGPRLTLNHNGYKNLKQLYI